jgi:Short C-terminal domain
MVMRPMGVRRRPLLRAAAIGGTFAAGRAMGRRSEAQQNQGQQAQAQQDPAQQDPAQQTQAQQVPPQGPTPMDAGGEPAMTDQLNQLAAMHNQGALSDEEFAAAKAKVLGG